MPDDALHRRDFGFQILAGVGAASVAAAAPVSNLPPPPALPEDAGQELPSVEFLLLTALLQRYPSDKYTDESLQGLFGDIAGDVARGKTLRSFPLRNGDEPATCFRVILRGERSTLMPADDLAWATIGELGRQLAPGKRPP